MVKCPLGYPPSVLDSIATPLFFAGPLVFCGDLSICTQQVQENHGVWTHESMDTFATINDVLQKNSSRLGTRGGTLDPVNPKIMWFGHHKRQNGGCDTQKKQNRYQRVEMSWYHLLPHWKHHFWGLAHFRHTHTHITSNCHWYIPLACFRPSAHKMSHQISIYPKIYLPEHHLKYLKVPLKSPKYRDLAPQKNASSLTSSCRNKVSTEGLAERTKELPSWAPGNCHKVYTQNQLSHPQTIHRDFHSAGCMRICLPTPYPWCSSPKVVFFHHGSQELKASNRMIHHLYFGKYSSVPC